MNRERVKRLEDARDACAEIMAFAKGRSLGDLSSDRQFQLVQERLLEIVGEAINQALQADDSPIDVPSSRQIIGMRNRLIHGYDNVNVDLVWDVIENKVPALHSYLTILLEGAGS